MCSFDIIKSDHLSQVKGENRMPDYTRPPPGYLASGERLEQSSTLQSNCISSDSHILVIVFDIIGETIKNDIEVIPRVSQFTFCFHCSVGTHTKF